MSVSDRFIADLEKVAKTPVAKEREGHIEMIIQGMKCLQIKVFYHQAKAPVNKLDLPYG